MGKTYKRQKSEYPQDSLPYQSKKKKEKRREEDRAMKYAKLDTE